MIRILDVIAWLKSFVPGSIFVNDFPAAAPNAALMVRLTPGAPQDPWVPTVRPDMQILIRGDPGGDIEAESVCLSLLETLHGAKDVMISGRNLVLCSAEQSAPFYLGEDENLRPLYSINFSLILL